MREPLDELGREARRQVDEIDSDHRWRALADGTISDDDREALMELASTSEEARLKYEMLAPIIGDRRASMIERALAGIDTPVIPLRKKIAPVLGAIAAIAAGILALILVGPKFDDQLPQYSGEVRYGVAEVRSVVVSATELHKQVITLEPQMPFELTLRPQRAAPSEVELAGFMLSGGRLNPWLPSFERAATGAFRVNGRVTDLLPGVFGELELILVVGAPATLAELRARAADGRDVTRGLSSDSMRVIRVRANIRRSE